MEQQNKTDFMAILVYLAMIGLASLIVLPPVLRMLIKQEPVKIEEQDKLEVLICNKEQEVENNNFLIRATTTYKNNKLFRVILNYSKEKKEIPDAEVTNKETITDPFETFEEIKALIDVSGIQMTKNEEQVKIDLTENIFASNSDNEVLNNYSQIISKQQTYFETEGYTCQVTTN